ncbi:MAG: hypothetical protein OSA98_20500 [Rubripirellula sp.]|nr:hypothetical protein [Rubripirellula sp.]
MTPDNRGPRTPSCHLENLSAASPWAAFGTAATDAWLGHDDKTTKKHYSRVTEMDFKLAFKSTTTGLGGGDTEASSGAMRAQISSKWKLEN